ncbi:hypothetical protein A3K56_03535 [Candidatus Beckwithbacteria bacterium RIFCSPHIGHO2_12_FULL_49_13]|nr:MAG: hypothetical protein A3K56_03535 [Candidatus Beckwithbacteria bacterium RIFCSPHIGHO2_12_FULL_49_13]
MRLTVFQKIRTRPIVVWWWEFKTYLKFLLEYSRVRSLQLIGQFEAGKGVVVEGLTTKRGRYTRPFLHTGMTGIFLVGLLLAPVLSQAAGEEGGTGGSVLGVVVGYQETTTSVSIKPRDSVVTYIVQEGDTVSSIAAKFDVSIDTIRWQNDLKSLDAIKPGQTLEIPPTTGIVHKVKRGETIYSIAKKYDVVAQNIVNWPFNTYADDETFALAVGQTLVVPEGVKPAEQLWDPSRYVAQKTPDAGVVSATGQFAWPTSGQISQNFAWFHPAVDISNKATPAILAADSGRVVVAGWPDNFGYGNRVVIDHGNGFTTLYAHMASISVAVGQSVNRGDVIGVMGSTGRSTGPHLHFEIRANGATVNPLGYLK